MTNKISPASKSRFALQVVAACTLAAALNLLIVPVSFVRGYYVPFVFVLPFKVLQLFFPFVAFMVIRRYWPIPKTDESPCARMIGSAARCVIAAGLLWMTHDPWREFRFVVPGLLDLPWYGLLTANELARHGVHRRSRTLGLLALAALGVALGLAAALGTYVMHTADLEGMILPWFGWFYTCIAEQPWIAMLWLAGLWSWVALVDRRSAPREDPPPARK